jgi:hypothetical protein
MGEQQGEQSRNRRRKQPDCANAAQGNVKQHAYNMPKSKSNPPGSQKRYQSMSAAADDNVEASAIQRSQNETKCQGRARQLQISRLMHTITNATTARSLAQIQV